jgi:hypothetical protein
MIRKRIRSYKVGERGNVKGWHNALCGVPAFLIGNGPSLDRLDLSCLKRHFTIGINRAFFKIDPTILLWQDPETWFDHKADIARLKSIKFCRDISDPKGLYYHFRLAPGGFSLPQNPSTLHGSGASGPLAFQLAYVLGCDPIILLGFDCSYSSGKTNFYGKNRRHKPHTLSNCSRGLQWIKKCGSGRTIINCSPNNVFADSCLLEEVVARQSINSTSFSREVLLQRLSVR